MVSLIQSISNQSLISDFSAILIFVKFKLILMSQYVSSFFFSFSYIKIYIALVYDWTWQSSDSVSYGYLVGTDCMGFTLN